MIPAGIFLREISEINEEEDIYEQRNGLTSSDYTVQTNALYGFLCNEDVIPQEFQSSIFYYNINTVQMTNNVSYREGDTSCRSISDCLLRSEDKAKVTVGAPA